MSDEHLIRPPAPSRRDSPLPVRREDGSRSGNWMKFLGALAATGLLSGGLGGVGGAYGVSALTEYRLAEAESDLEEHAASEGHPLIIVRVTRVEAQLEALASAHAQRVTTVDARLARMETKIDTILERLPDRGRR